LVLVRAFRSPDEGSAERELEDAKLAKYRELRELDLDWGTGKLRESDYRETRAQLRAEAATLLQRTSPTSHEAVSVTDDRPA
jgi:hypothetical protein